MIRLWINGIECDVPADFQPEMTYKITDANGLETQCSSYSMSLDIPITATNMTVFTPLFDIQTVFGSVSFDIHANVDAIMEVNNTGVRGYVKMESVDTNYHLRFYTNAGRLLEKLRTMKLSDLPLGDIPFSPIGVRSSITKNYDAVYGTGTDDEHFTYFPAFSDDEQTYDTYVAGMWGGQTIAGQFGYTYLDADGNPQKGAYNFTHHQARNYNMSGLRAAVQMKWVFTEILSAAGFTFTPTGLFFQNTNPYWKNLFMVLKQRTGDTDNPITFGAAEFMPDMSCEDFILGYCKLFGLWIVVDGTKVDFLTRFEYYDITTLPDISGGIDRKIGLAVKPNPYEARQISCGLQVEDTDDATYGRSFKDATNLYEGVAFKYGEMMQYRGPRVMSWVSNGGRITVYTISQGGMTLPFISSTDGGELYFRFNNYNVDSVRIYNDTLNGVFDGISGYGSSAYASLPEITTLNADKPLYADRAEIRFNYKYKVAVPAQRMFAADFAAYVGEIRSKDNVEIDCEGWFMPDKVQYLTNCRAVVMLDKVRCRVLECVTDGSGRCKLRLQKIDDMQNLIAGQGFSGYYIRSTNYPDYPLLAIPSTAQVGDVFNLPVETNDTITSISTLPTWLTDNGDGTVTLNTDPSTLLVTTTLGDITNAVQPRVAATRTVTTAHAGSINVSFVVYSPNNTVFYWPDIDPHNVSALTGPLTLVPALFGKLSGYGCKLFDDTGAPFSGDAYIDASVDNNGVVTIERKTIGAWAGRDLIVATYSGGTYHAMSYKFTVRSLQ